MTETSFVMTTCSDVTSPDLWRCFACKVDIVSIISIITVCVF